jgi:hypothetical protein
MTKEQRFQKKVRDLIKNTQNLEAAEVQKVIKLLASARRDIASAVAETDWQAYQLPRMKDAVERAMAEFGTKYGVDLRDAQLEFWNTGIDAVDMPLRTVGVKALIPEIDTTVLGIMQGYGADLVKGLAKDAALKINNELTLGLMGQKTPYEVMQAVGKNLKDKSIFTSIAARAETITRTECGRVLEAASQARLEKAGKVVKGLQKQWIYGTAPRRVPRLAHVAADKQIRDVDKPFNVGGEQLMYPRDPAGSARNTINCGCYMAPYRADWDSAVNEPKMDEAVNW